MPKRRRERDRPKTGPESLYNPNKRVLLSYASDDEEEEEAAVDNAPDQTKSDAAEAVIDDRAIANYQMTEYPDSENEVELGATGDEDVGASDGKDEDVEEVGDDADDDGAEEDTGPSSTPQDKVTDDWAPPTKKDPVTHQRPTLGPVSFGQDEDDEEDYDPETEEAMAYLRAVRSERQTIPEILSAPRQLQVDADQLQDTNQRNPDEPPIENDAIVSSDTFVQATPVNSEPTPLEGDATDPQKVFTRLLIERFMEQRTQLHLPPSMHKLAELPDSCPISFPRGNNRALAEWYHVLSEKAPLPAQLRSMDQDSIFNLLGLLQEHYLTKVCELNKVTSAWIWSLLARLDDVGTMNNDEVFPLRELGKRAVFLLLSFSSPELAAGLESLGQDAPSIASTEANQAEIAPQAPTDNTLATLDMMLVVIGHVFGQKDLLEFRPKWTVTEKPV
ncbi:uncharacterized protein RCC_06370 [Ramularia collo-cygni]|uniref:Uncharacterized protein n=1 Tax=Ramularia collo-cygni TaxID=112498 RepID=A0A2D3V4Y7_9PEZI|nr:uncharacterized protein RCC_06370 [Ramularia collo-cygni]CZT20510.1 uncharacterized protein RCC_06370 [Ramularia collo-cygni]